MKHLGLTMVLVAALAGAAWAAGPVERNEPNYAPIAVGPSASPSDVEGISYAKAFTLDRPYAYTWRADAPAITTGWVLVVDVTPALSVQKDTWNPVLYVGRYPAEIAGVDPEQGRMVVIVPGEVDLSRDAVFFGSVELPGQVTPERAGEELAAAVAAGFGPVSAETLRRARAAGGETAALADAHALYAGPVAEAIETWAEADRGRAQGYRVPLVGTR